MLYAWKQFWMKRIFHRQMWGLSSMNTVPEQRIKSYKRLTGQDYHWSVMWFSWDIAFFFAGIRK